ncbi:MAG: DUF6056 family protein [Desulfuromonadales bacterium]|nr:DUF6056 family protein [Desulfuromonadales bacterium]MDW7757186.1 DUF6056 family protein [Desulfuromonadales bacterium]
MPQNSEMQGDMQRKCWQVFSLCFFAFLLAQHRLVFPYHDDWGYATLSYSTEVVTGVGRDFSQADLIQFLYQEYQNWSGRFFPFFLQINLFKFGVEAVRLVQIFVLVTIVFSAVVVFQRGRELWSSLLLIPVAYFLALPTFVTAGGLYWFSASIAYAWGVALFGVAIGLIIYKGHLYWPSTVLVALAALFHEQMSVAMFAFMLAYTFFLSLQRATFKVLYQEWPHHVIVLGAALLVILAPGNYVRRNVSTYPHEGIFATIWANAKDIATFLLNSEGGPISLFAVLALIVFASKICSYVPARRILVTGVAVVTVLFGVVKLFPPIVTVGLWLVGFTVMHFVGVRKGWIPPAIAATFVAAVASLLLLLFAPGVSGRALLTFYLLMLFPSVYWISIGWVWNRWLMVLVAMLAIMALPQAIKTYKGYSANAPYHKANHAKLLAAGFDTLHNIGPKTLLLYRLPEERYAETMPYQRDIIYHWLRRYYQVPDMTFQWLDPDHARR